MLFFIYKWWNWLIQGRRIDQMIYCPTLLVAKVGGENSNYIVVDTSRVDDAGIGLFCYCSKDKVKEEVAVVQDGWLLEAVDKKKGRYWTWAMPEE